MAFVDLPGQVFVTGTDYNGLQSITADFPVLVEDPVGVIRHQIDQETNGTRTLQFVNVLAATTVANGTALMFSDLYRKTVTKVVASASRNQPAGVGIGAITAGNRGWIQIAGYHSAVITNADDDITDGDSIIMSATDGKVDSTAAGTAPTHKTLGIAVADDDNAADTVAVQLNCLYV